MANDVSMQFVKTLFNGEFSCLKSDEDRFVLCPATKTPLFRREGESLNIVASHGICEECGMEFYVSYLRIPDAVFPSKWPLRYLGYYCKDCYKLDY